MKWTTYIFLCAIVCAVMVLGIYFVPPFSNAIERFLLPFLS